MLRFGLQQLSLLSSMRATRFWPMNSTVSRAMNLHSRMKLTAIIVFISGFAWSAGAISASMSITFILIERLIALIYPLIYHRRFGVNFSILTIISIVCCVTTLCVMMIILEAPLDLSVKCETLSCLFPHTQVQALLISKLVVGSLNLLLSIVVFAAIQIYSSALPVHN